MIHELNHFGIVVSDLDASLAFYRDLLGARVVFKGLIPDSQTDVVYLQIHGGLVELLYTAEPATPEVHGITHIAFMTDSLDADFAALVAAGAEPLVQPKVAGTGVGRLAFLNDPNGARVELLERDLHIRIDPIEHPHIIGFDHYAVNANNLACAESFYLAGLGMKPLKELSFPSGRGTIKYLHYDYDVLELLHYEPARNEPPFAHLALRVRDLDEVLQDFAEHGLLPQPGTPRPSSTATGRVAVIHDPDGVVIELLDRADLREP
jgi:catechol 2,3-dioxygenase-like lactoylglutathione lyase family enzyme